MPTQSGGEWLYPSQYSVTNNYCTINKFSLSGKPQTSQNRPSTPCTPTGRNFANDLVRQFTPEPRTRWKPRTPAERRREAAAREPSTHRPGNEQAGKWTVASKTAQSKRLQQRPRTAPPGPNCSAPRNSRPSSGHPLSEQLTMVEAVMQQRGMRPYSAAAAPSRSLYLTKDDRKKLPPKAASTVPRKKQGTVYTKPGAGEKGHLCTRARTSINFCPSGVTESHRISTMKAAHSREAAGRPPLSSQRKARGPYH